MEQKYNIKTVYSTNAKSFVRSDSNGSIFNQSKNDISPISSENEEASECARKSQCFQSSDKCCQSSNKSCESSNKCSKSSYKSWKSSSKVSLKSKNQNVSPCVTTVSQAKQWQEVILSHQVQLMRNQISIQQQPNFDEEDLHANLKMQLNVLYQQIVLQKHILMQKSSQENSRELVSEEHKVGKENKKTAKKEQVLKQRREVEASLKRYQKQQQQQQNEQKAPHRHEGKVDIGYLISRYNL